MLVFLPGKAEIEACAQSLRAGPYRLFPLHGGLSLDEQRRAFEPSSQRKLILATNVAETSLTIPGVGVVIDAGLVRQMRYQAGRGSLALVPIAEDSAAQRTGRAGRTAPGVCYRLWSAAAKLEKSTLPEMHRESLVPLVLGAVGLGSAARAAAACSTRPRPYALEAARADLQAWGALAADGCAEREWSRAVQPAARAAARTPAAQREAARVPRGHDRPGGRALGRPPTLSGRHVGRARRRPSRTQAATPPPSCRRCARRVPRQQGVSSLVLHEARAARTRLRRMHELPVNAPTPRKLDREALIRAALSADPRLAHVARARGRELFFSNGGTEVELARESAVRNVRKLEALVVLDTRAFGAGREARVLITCAMAVPLATLARAGLGSERIAAVQLEKKRVVCTLERVYAKRVLAEREETAERRARARGAGHAARARQHVSEAVATTRRAACTQRAGSGARRPCAATQRPC